MPLAAVHTHIPQLCAHKRPLCPPVPPPSHSHTKTLAHIAVHCKEMQTLHFSWPQGSRNQVRKCAISSTCLPNSPQYAVGQTYCYACALCRFVKFLAWNSFQYLDNTKFHRNRLKFCRNMKEDKNLF